MGASAVEKTTLERTRARLIRVAAEQRCFARNSSPWLFCQARIDYLLEEYLKLARAKK